MAILKDLIVHGSSRFLNKIYASEIQTPLIEAEAGVFKKLKADDATVVGLLDVKGQLHTNSWSNSNIATIDGSFYITPTIGSASGTVTITASTLTFSGTNYAISSLYLGDGSSITWPQYSKVLVTGQILSNGEWIPLGTLLGQLSSTATAASISINNIKDNKNQTSNVLATLVSNETTSSSYRNLKVSLYQRASSSTAFYPLGIYMTATGTNGRTFLDIYGGVEALSNSNNYGGFAEPNVRIGNLQGLPNVGGQTPSGWGIYTDNGYFKGIIAADKGYIGSGSKYWVIANEEDVSNVENSRSYIYNGTDNINSNTPGVYLGTDGIRNYKDSTHFVKINQGIIEAQGVKLSGQITATSGSIAGWTIKNTYLASNNATAPGNNILILSPKGTTSSYIVGGSESINGWVLTAGANFGVTKTGALYANSANISGKVVATSGSIGGVNIVDGNLDVSSISIGSLNGASNYAQKSYVDDAVDNIEIGGRNLLKNSNVVNTSLSDSVIGGTATRTIPSGTVITLSVQIDADDVVWGSSGNKRIGVASSVIKDSGGNQYIEAWAAMTGRTGTGIDKTFDTSFHGRVKSTYTLQGELPLDKTFSLYVQSVTSGTVSVSKPKLEIGNKATDWIPAPEDTQEDINNVSTVANTALSQSVEYIIGTQTAATGSWTGETNDSSLIAGKTIAYKLPYAGSGNASLNLTLANGTTTGAKAVYLNTTRVTTHFGAGSIIQMTYNGTDWRVTSIPNTNTVGTLGATKLIAGTNVSNTSATTVYRYTLIMKKTAGDNPTWVSLVTSSSTATSKTRYTGGLYPDKIFYMSSNVSSSPYGYNTGASTGDSYAALGFDLRYSTNCGSTLVIGKPVYLVGEINSLDGLFYLDQTWWTQTEPTIEDNKTYIYLGNAYSTTNVYLVEKNPLMRYYRGAFRTEEQIAGMTATSYITYANANDGIKIHNANDLIDYIQINSDAISMYRRDTQQLQTSIETLRIQSDNIRIGKIGTGKRNVFITDSAVEIRNNITTLASYGDSIVLGNEDSLSQITLSQTGVVFTPKTIANSTESAGTFKYIVNESGHSYTLVEESASNQNTGTATSDPLRLNNNTYYSNTESFSDVILAKVNNEFWVLGKTNETETSVVVQSIGTDSETWNYNSTPVTKTIITYVTMEETQETTVEQEDGSEEIENIIVQVNYQITRVESWEKWNVTSGTIPENYIYSGYIKKDSFDETNQDLYSINYQKKISTSQSSTGTTLNVNVATDITTSLSFRQMTDFYENKNLGYITTEPDFSILFGKDVWTNSPYSYILGGEKNVIKTNSTVPALYSTIVGGYQNGYFYNKHANTPSLEDTLYKMGIECFIGNGYGNSVQSNLSSIVGGQYNAIYDGESFSVIGGGYNNSIQTWYDDTISGNTNFYNAPYQFLGGGKNNSSRSDYGVLVGGYNNINLGKYSVISGGASNKTVGQYSVITGGNNNTVLGENSYAHGYLNIAEGNNQTVLGKANIPDSTSLLIVGNGTSNSNRSNALTLNQNGSLTIAMDLNLHSPHSILLAQKSDYAISPSNLMKANRIYANQYAGTMNNYYISQGYHSYYANGNWILSLESAKINSAVPLQAPNNVQWIDNTNNISRANVIYYGSPSTSDHPTATANQPANGWYYYRQLAASGGYNILLGVGMNSNNPTLRIRGRYKDVSTNTYKWTGWIDFSKVGHTHSNYALSSHTHPISDITSSTTTLSITRSISTTYMTATSFARLVAKKKDRVLYLYFNAWFDGSDYSVSDFTTIATISSWNAISDAVISVPCQNDGTKVLTIMVTSTGTIRVYSAKAISGWYRAFICVPSSS